MRGWNSLVIYNTKSYKNCKLSHQNLIKNVMRAQDMGDRGEGGVKFKTRFEIIVGHEVA